MPTDVTPIEFNESAKPPSSDRLAARRASGADPWQNAFSLDSSYHVQFSGLTRYRIERFISPTEYDFWLWYLAHDRGQRQGLTYAWCARGVHRIMILMKWSNCCAVIEEIIDISLELLFG